GDDRFYVDNAGDQVIENIGEGNDTVYAAMSYTLGANVENLNFVGTGAFNGTGNDLDNVIVGTHAGNTSYDLGRNDHLDGWLGADTMYGGLNDDWYSVDNAGDQVIEYANEGYDHVLSTITYTLTDNVEYLNLMGSSAINGTGNGLDNYLIGNGADNT